MDKARIAWIDALKGFGIILVILGHMTIPKLASELIYSFHMPMFFFISGYLHRGGFSIHFCLRKVDSLLLPYLVYGLMYVGTIWLTGNGDATIGFCELMKGNGAGATWFLTCLFMTEILGGWLVLLLPKKQHLYIAVLLVSIVGWLVPNDGMPSVLMLRKVLPSTSIWLLGYLLRGYRPTYKGLILSSLAVVFFVLRHKHFDIGFTVNGLISYMTAVGFILMTVFAFGLFVKNNRYLEFIGTRSLIFMCLQSVVPQLLVMVVGLMGYEHLNVVSKFALRMFSFGTLFCLAWLISGYSPLLSGKVRLFQRIAR